MRTLEWIAEQRIAEAVSQGELDDLPLCLLGAKVEARYFRKTLRKLSGKR